MELLVVLPAANIKNQEKKLEAELEFVKLGTRGKDEVTVTLGNNNRRSRRRAMFEQAQRSMLHHHNHTFLKGQILNNNQDNNILKKFES